MTSLDFIEISSDLFYERDSVPLLLVKTKLYGLLCE